MSCCANTANSCETQRLLAAPNPLGRLNSPVAAYYYLRVLVVMNLHEPETIEHVFAIRGELNPTTWITVAATMVLGGVVP